MVRGARLECPSPTRARRGFAPAGDTKISSDLVPTARVFEMSSHSLPAQRGPRAPRRGRRSRSRQCKFPYRCAWARLQGAPVRERGAANLADPQSFPAG